MPQISRRRFVAGLGAGMVPGFLRAAATPTDKTVIVVGAGLAGLAACYELSEAGVNVRLIEQSQRPGGRVKTIRGHFADDAWVDVGGQTSGGMYANFFFYSTKLGLAFEAEETPAERPDVLLHLNNKLYSAAALRRDPSAWPVKLHEHEKPLAPFRLLSHYLEPIAKQIGAVENVLTSDFVQYDELSLRQLLKERGASDAAIGQIDHTLNYNSVDTVSALSALRDVVRFLHMRGGQALNLQNGNQSLPEAFASHLVENVQYGCKLKAVNQTSRGVQLQVETKGGRESLYGEKVIVALPFTALRKVRIEPGLPPQRQKIINELPYTQIAQTYLQTRTRFWETDGPVAAVVSDGPLERLFNASSKMKDERGLLVNWVNGHGVQGITGSDPKAHLERVLIEMQAIWPHSRDQVQQTLTNNWGTSYVEGAYAHYAPGQMAAFAAQIPKPVGDIHFAGEHTELVAPGMEGALTSGKRAAAEVLDAIET
ncbi:MAG: flavin monoamine oxidase family protein [Woeseiaceae bacterium]